MKIIRDGKIKVITENIIEYLVSDLEAERDNLLAELNQPEPSDKELIEYGKMYHPHYEPKERLNERLKEIDSLLGVK